MKVLVADHSEPQRRLFAAHLRELGVELVEAASGAEALAHLLRADGPRVALLDWEMPGLSGVEVVQQVRAAPLEVRPHLVLVTARPERADVVQALQAGADDFIGRPPHPPDLRARVEVGVRNVKLQQELQQRFDELKSTLRRLDAVGALAARRGPRATREGALQPALEGLDAVRGLPERLASVVGDLGGPGAPDATPELWAHLALALPAQAAWLDVTLEVGRALATSVVEKLGRGPATEQGLLDGVSDVLSLVLRGFLQQLALHGAGALTPYPSRGSAGRVTMPPAPALLVLSYAGWTLRVLETPAEVQRLKFSELQPGDMLVEPLVPPHLPTVEVLARGTVLKPSYLARAASFFKGEAARASVPVMPSSPFSREHR
jgi:sigma-B regulation protein RsbU (phosphoserine phosphatase)